MPEFNIDTFRNKFRTGARSYLFYLTPVFPITLGGPWEEGTYLVRSTSLQSSSFDDLISSWQGFDYKTAGKRTFDTWSCSFTVDLNANIRKKYAQWANLILNPADNKHAFPEVYQVTQSITLVGLDFNDIMKYNLRYAYPSQIGETTLDYANSDFATMDITFTYTYFETE